MKLTDFLSDVGRPVAYYPELRKITGSVTATILLCQFIYWRGKESGQDGWLYKTADDIQDETGLSYGEQKTARRDLVTAGLLKEHYARLDHQMRFKLDLDAINEKWGNQVFNNGESSFSTFGNDAKPFSLNESENTAENTSLQTDEEKGKYQIKGIEAALFSDRPVTKDDLPVMELALKEFESALSLPANWNWYPAKSGDERAWRELRDFVLLTWQADNQAFRKYASWRATPYVKGALSNLAIQRRPTEFITSWSDYLASSSMYGNSYNPNEEHRL